MDQEVSKKSKTKAWGVVFTRGKALAQLGEGLVQPADDGETERDNLLKGVPVSKKQAFGSGGQQERKKK